MSSSNNTGVIGGLEDNLAWEKVARNEIYLMYIDRYGSQPALQIYKVKI